jgi:hypothetical protein
MVNGTVVLGLVPGEGKGKPWCPLCQSRLTSRECLLSDWGGIFTLPI